MRTGPYGAVPLPLSNNAVTKVGEAYVKTGHRPYRTDLGLLSKGRGYGSNLDG